jgi:PAS domain S-box-containing protein
MAEAEPPRQDGDSRATADAALKDSEARLSLLSEAGLMLARSLDPTASLKEVARRTIGILGDACFVDVIDENGNLARIAWAHVSPETQTQFDALWPRVAPTRYSLHPGAVAIFEGVPIFEPNVDDAWLVRMAMNNDHLAFMRSIGPHSALVVPMRMDATPFGAITLWFTRDKNRRHTLSDLDLAMELGRRASIAISHARQHRALAQMNAHLETMVAERTRERDRMWTISDDMMSIVGRDGFLKAVNPAWRRVLGFDEATLLSTPYREFGHAQDQAGGDAALARLAQGEDVSRFEARMRHADGGWRWISWTVVPEVDRYYAIGRDFTEQHSAADELASANRLLLEEIEERERAEATLHQMQRLEAVGQLTTGVAHDFNNLLTVVLGNLAFLERQFTGSGDKKLTARLANMRIAAERGAKLTSQLLAFSRRQHLEPATLSLNDTVRSMRDLLQTAVGAGIRTELELTESLWPAYADPTQIELVVLNLAINARDAMEKNGVLTIFTGNVSLGQPRSAEEPAQGDYVEIKVADTGVGMEAGTLARAFEPFFTTKETGRGSGLGLSQVLGFAKQSGGGVRLMSVPGVGTSVQVFLPRAANRPTQTTGESSVFVNGHASARVLLVDDEAPVREVIAQTLRDLGHHVVEAGSGGAALAIMEGDPSLDVALLDFAMPGMNGAELARQIRTRHPGVCVLFVTGYAETEELADIADERIIKKPLRQADLARKLQTALAAHAG